MTLVADDVYLRTFVTSLDSSERWNAKATGEQKKTFQPCDTCEDIVFIFDLFSVSHFVTKAKSMHGWYRHIYFI